VGSRPLARLELPERHRLLLAAALGGDERMWSRWLELTPANRADGEESRILPMVADRLGDAVGASSLGLLRGQRRQITASSLVRMSATRDVVAGLAERGVPAVCFKGIAMVAHYPSSAVRTMNDSDLLVPFHLRDQAIDALLDFGFVPGYGLPVDTVRAFHEHTPGVAFKRVADRLEVDLHWWGFHHTVPGRSTARFHGRLFDRAASTTTRVGALVAPHPSDHAVLIAAHGARHDSGALLIGAVDVAMLLRSFRDGDVAAAIEAARDADRGAALVAVADLVARFAAPDSVEAEHASRLASATTRIGRIDRATFAMMRATDVSTSRRAETRRDLLVAVGRTPLASGGPVGGLVGLARRRAGVARARELPQWWRWRRGAIAVAGGRTRSSRSIAPSLPTATDAVTVTADGTSLSVPARRLDSFGPGWWFPEGNLTWSVARCAALRLRPSSPGAGVLSFAAVPFIGGERTTQRVTVIVSGVRRGVWQWDQHALVDPSGAGCTVEITTADRVDGVVDLTFVIDDPASPLEVGASVDPRPLALGLVQVRWSPSPR
jgi:hypothetical protein